MLYLKRKPGQTIHIGNDIVIHVKGLDQGEAHIGIEAPRSYKIDRGECKGKKPTNNANEINGNK